MVNQREINFWRSERGATSSLSLRSADFQQVPQDALFVITIFNAADEKDIT